MAHPATPPQRWKRRAGEFGRRPVAFLAASLVLLAPCFWGSRLQAGDLSSHVYNAWLAQLIAEGRAPGLTLVTQSTNVLFDLLLGGMLPRLGAGPAQRIAVSLAVLAFAWGAFAFASAVAGRRAWHVLPMIAMLAYGWVFHVGFFNFYLSLGLCFGAAALAWERKRTHLLAAVPLLALAYIAHALPLIWILGLIGYLWLAARIPAKHRVLLALGAALAVIGVRAAVVSAFATRWYAPQLRSATGLDQFTLFDDKYLAISIGVLALWLVSLARLLRERGVHGVVTSHLLHACLLTALGIALVPALIKLPAYDHALVFIAERMSLALCVCMCALLAQARTGWLQACTMGAVALLFFTFLFRDERAINRYEDRMEKAVSQLPAGQRVVNGITAPQLRLNPLAHMIDRVCIGRCFSYANYEPSTGQFRVRVAGPSPLVLSTYEESWLAQSGSYVVQPRDLPLYQVLADDSGQPHVREVPAGSPVGMTYWNPL